MPKLLPRHYAKILYELTEGLGAAQIADATQKFIQLLERRNVLKKIPYIIAEFTRYAEEQQGIQSLQITSATELSAATVKKIAQGFGAKTQATTIIDEGILGGIIIQTRQAILDASVKNRLQQLSHTLNQEHSHL